MSHWNFGFISENHCFKMKNPFMRNAYMQTACMLCEWQKDEKLKFKADWLTLWLLHLQIVRRSLLVQVFTACNLPTLAISILDSVFFVCISNRFLPLVYTLVVYISARTVRCSLKHIRSRSISILFLIELNYNKFPSITWLAVTVH